MVSKITDFLSKYEKYLNNYSTLITSENWAYYKENGCFKPLTNDEKLIKKQLQGGWNKELIWDDFISGVLTKESIEELILNNVLMDVDMKKIAGKLESELCEYAFGNGDSPYKEEDLIKILDFLEEKGY